MHEDTLIERYLFPLTKNAVAAQGLKDDVAFLETDRQRLIFTTDTIVEGVHFFSSTPPARIAQKLWRTNLSDLAGKGATPLGFLLNLSLPQNVAHNETWLAEFSHGIARELDLFGGALWGGDTVRSSQLILSVTAIGEIHSPLPSRRNACTGDIIIMSGHVGDAALGLKILEHSLSLPDAIDAAPFIERYHAPIPRLELGKALAHFSHAMMDCSDGPMKDISRLCSAANVGAKIDVELLPISPAAMKLSKIDAAHTSLVRDAALCGGDDYELIATISPSDLTRITEIAASFNERVTVIGEITSERAVSFMLQGAPYAPQWSGFEHFI